MKRNKIVWVGAGTALVFITLWLVWFFQNEERPEREVKVLRALETAGPRARPKTVPQDDIEPITQKKTISHREESARAEDRLYNSILGENQDFEKIDEACRKKADELFDDHDFIDPQSEFYSDTERVEALLFDALDILHNYAAMDSGYEIESFLAQHDPRDAEGLLTHFTNFQESCLDSRALIFFKTTIENCYDPGCDPRIKTILGNIIFDGMALTLHGALGAERMLFVMNLLETSERFGLYSFNEGGGLNELRYRVQQNYEVMKNEFAQAQGNSARQGQALREYIEENKFLQRELVQLIKTQVPPELQYE